jgi:hypothetical protein
VLFALYERAIGDAKSAGVAWFLRCACGVVHGSGNLRPTSWRIKTKRNPNVGDSRDRHAKVTPD